MGSYRNRLDAIIYWATGFAKPTRLTIKLEEGVCLTCKDAALVTFCKLGVSGVMT